MEWSTWDTPDVGKELVLIINYNGNRKQLNKFGHSVKSLFGTLVSALGPTPLKYHSRTISNYKCITWFQK